MGTEETQAEMTAAFVARTVAATLWEYQASTNGSDYSGWSMLPLGKVTSRYFKFRLTISGQIQCGILENATVIVDVPDQYLAFIGLVVPVGGIDISFVPAYVNEPAILATPKGAAIAMGMKRE